MRPGLPDRVHRHGRRRHEGPLPRPLGRARDVRRAARGVGAAPLRPAGAGPGLRALRRRSTRRRSTRSSSATTTTRREMLAILEATQAAYGHLPVAALKHISHETGAWYASSTAPRRYYRHLRFEPPAAEPLAAADGRRRRRPRDRVPGRARGRARRLGGLGPRAARAPARGRPRPRDGAARRPAPARPGPDDDDDPRTPKAGRDPPARRPRPIPLDLDGAPRPRRVRGPPARGPRPRADRHDRDDRRVRAARPRRRAASRPATSGAPPRRPTRRRRYVVANGYEADPASQTDRTLMERDPYARPRGRRPRRLRGRRRPRRSSPSAPRTTDAIRALEAAIAARRGGRLPGRRRPRHRPRHRVEVRPVQGAFMLGEETVLLRALEDKRGQPEQRPPYPPSAACSGSRPSSTTSRPSPPCRGSWPTAPRRSPRSADGRSPGTILVQVSGAVGERASPRSRSGRRSARSSTSAGALPAARLKARPRRRPVGRVPAGRARSTRRTTFDALRAAGANVGSGTIVVADDRACIVDLAPLLTRFCADEACGKTIPCRIGLRRRQRDRRAARRPAVPSRPTRSSLADLVDRHRGSALCGHERLATLPLLERDAILRAEFEEHILRSTCPAGVCRPDRGRRRRGRPLTRR